MNILMVGAHWDDIELGCGATLLRHLNNGDNVIIEILTNSAYTSTIDSHKRDLKTIQRNLALYYGSFPGIPIHFHTEPTFPLHLKYSTEAAQRLERTVINNNIDRVYYHSDKDINTDHIAVNEICKVAFRNVCDQLLFASNWYGFKFNPYIFSFFTEKEYKEKEKIVFQLDKDEMEYRKDRWEVEIKGRDRLFGARFGHDYAEGFEGRISI